MKVPGLGIAAALLLMALAPSTAFAGLSGSDGTAATNPSAEAINRAVTDASPPGAVGSEQHDKGKKDVPALLAAAKAPCTMTDGYFVGAAPGPDKVQTSYYEVSCKEGMGFILSAKEKGAVPELDDCVKFFYMLPNGKPNPLTCRLPGNKNTAATLQSYVTKAGHTCTVSKSRFLGSTPALDLYEAACTEGGGYILEKSRDDSKPPSTTNCLIYAAASSNIKCTLITDAQQDSYLDKLVAASGKPCVMSAHRVVGAFVDGTDGYEVACKDNTGFIIKTSANGGFGEATDCLKATNIGDGCKLTDTRQAQTQQTNLYSSLSRKAGFDCNVSKYADFPGSDANTEVVELACSNRPDGGVGFFPAGAGQSRVLDCLRAEDEGYKCSFTPVTPLFAKLTEQLRAKGKTSCIVSNAASHGYADAPGGGKEDFIEVACADGGPGYVLHYGATGTAPIELLNCAQVKSSGGCKLSKMN